MTGSNNTINAYCVQLYFKLWNPNQLRFAGKPHHHHHHQATSSEYVAMLSQTNISRAIRAERRERNQWSGVRRRLLFRCSIHSLQNTKCWSLSVKKRTRIIDSNKQNRHFIEKSIERATWLLETKTLICSLMFSTIAIYFIDSEWGLENINQKT